MQIGNTNDRKSVDYKIEISYENNPDNDFLLDLQKKLVKALKNQKGNAKDTNQDNDPG